MITSDACCTSARSRSSLRRRSVSTVSFCALRVARASRSRSTRRRPRAPRARGPRGSGNRLCAMPSATASSPTRDPEHAEDDRGPADARSVVVEVAGHVEHEPDREQRAPPDRVGDERDHGDLDRELQRVQAAGTTVRDQRRREPARRRARRAAPRAARRRSRRTGGATTNSTAHRDRRELRRVQAARRARATPAVSRFVASVLRVRRHASLPRGARIPCASTLPEDATRAYRHDRRAP